MCDLSKMIIHYLRFHCRRPEFIPGRECPTARTANGGSLVTRPEGSVPFPLRPPPPELAHCGRA